MILDDIIERKRREVDPVFESVREALVQAEEHPEGVALKRLRQMEQMLGTLDRLAERALTSSDQTKALIAFILGKR